MKVLVLTNHLFGLYKFRLELLEKLKRESYDVLVSAPFDSHSDIKDKMAVEVVQNVFLDRRGTNPIKDLKLVRYYKSLIRKYDPDVVLTYTIKPNVYGGYVCGRLGVPYIVNVTGLGTSLENEGIIQKITLFLYRAGLKHACKVFFQNIENRQFMIDKGVVREEQTNLLPGSGVNTVYYDYLPYPDESNGIVFTTIGRIMKDKGIDELLSAACEIRKKHSDVTFRLIGEFDEAYEEKIIDLDKQGVIQYLGFQEDVRKFVSESHAIIHASYHEGMSNVLLEAASMGRPVIATDVPGCRETFDSGVTGIAFKPKSVESLIEAIEDFLSLDKEKHIEMGKAGRDKIVREFDRKIVIDKYMFEIIKNIREGS